MSPCFKTAKHRSLFSINVWSYILCTYLNKINHWSLTIRTMKSPITIPMSQIRFAVIQIIIIRILILNSPTGGSSTGILSGTNIKVCHQTSNTWCCNHLCWCSTAWTRCWQHIISTFCCIIEFIPIHHITYNAPQTCKIGRFSCIWQFEVSIYISIIFVNTPIAVARSINLNLIPSGIGSPLTSTGSIRNFQVSCTLRSCGRFYRIEDDGISFSRTCIIRTARSTETLTSTGGNHINIVCLRITPAFSRFTSSIHIEFSSWDLCRTTFVNVITPTGHVECLSISDRTIAGSSTNPKIFIGSNTHVSHEGNFFGSNSIWSFVCYTLNLPDITYTISNEVSRSNISCRYCSRVITIYNKAGIVVGAIVKSRIDEDFLTRCHSRHIYSRPRLIIYALGN